MIEIIKYGSKNQKFQLTCPFCACEFKYEKSDLEDDSFIRCPDCGCIIDHNFYQKEKFKKQH